MNSDFEKRIAFLEAKANEHSDNASAGLYVLTLAVLEVARQLERIASKQESK